ncbi:epithelial zinc-finger ezf protein [Diplodia corticola]|uniref:C2H2 type master regulator of conidiophore development brlA n=1 Tax=Diplodia corticola TaxID=236234 RepID=A0A1J9SKV0_9PEZI|nr:epithelial zinc-finger ezf protein [Diplodia corticola]OJD40364.1 epithelial zinc-finger ezf protein [Diplodia corticola]
MEDISPRSPSQALPFESSYGQGSYTQSSTYPSPARTESDASSYMTDSMALYSQYPSMALSNDSVHPAQTLYPLSPHPTEAPWTPSLPATTSPGVPGGQRSRLWADTYDTMPVWDQSFTYLPSGSLVGVMHSPAPSDGALLSQRSSVCSYDHSPDSGPMIKIEPQNELASEEDSVVGHQPLTVSPQRLGNVKHTTTQSDDSTVNTSTVRTRSRRATTRENANHQCHICGKLFQRGYNHSAHMETHNPNRKKPNACPRQGCGKRFVRRTDLHRHDQSVHRKIKNHKCTACGAHFARKDTLRRHREDGCPKRFDVVARQAQRAKAVRKHRALPTRAPSYRSVPRGMSALGRSAPYFCANFLPSVV